MESYAAVFRSPGSGILPTKNDGKPMVISVGAKIIIKNSKVT
jgi:hypothetical protein